MFQSNGNQLCFPDPVRVLAVGAHPDDIEAGAGGLLILLSQEKAGIALCVLTDGAQGGCIETRRREARLAAHQLGAELVLGGLPDTRLRLRDAIGILETLIKRFKPDIILVHYPRDTHQDHRIVTAATLSVGREVSNLLFYEGPSTLGFTPMTSLEISTVMKQKLALIRLHQSQMDRTRIDTWAGVTAIYRGFQMNRSITYAEAFHPFREQLSLGPIKAHSHQTSLARDGDGWHELVESAVNLIDLGEPPLDRSSSLAADPLDATRPG